eukprot:m.118742 g.118742  ORF g.118742 m.118742 type:complete len:105 (+) comp15573_c0_seq1:1065-1379(+)
MRSWTCFQRNWPLAVRSLLIIEGFLPEFVVNSYCTSFLLTCQYDVIQSTTFVEIVLSSALTGYSSIDTGSSMYFLNSFSHWAPTAPSTTRWSQDSVTVITLAVL